MTCVVTWVGGPRDGEQVAMQSAVPYINVAISPDPIAMRDEDPMEVTLKKLECPVRLTRNGYRAYWYEGRMTQ